MNLSNHLFHSSEKYGNHDAGFTISSIISGSNSFNPILAPFSLNSFRCQEVAFGISIFNEFMWKNNVASDYLCRTVPCLSSEQNGRANFLKWSEFFSFVGNENELGFVC